MGNVHQRQLVATAGGRARVETYGFVILKSKFVGKSTAQNIAVDCCI